MFSFPNYTNSIQSVRESWIPSAMVDNNGDLYTLNFYTFNDSKKGPRFQFCKYPASGSGRVSKLMYLWHKLYGDCDYRVNDFKKSSDGDKYWINNALFNVFSPTLAQEALSSGSASDLYVFGWAFPARYGFGSGTDGGFAFKISKSLLNSGGGDLSVSRSKVIAWNENGNVFAAERFPFRASNWLYKLQPEWGFCKAVYDGNLVQLYHIANKSAHKNDVTAVETQVYYEFYDAYSLELKNGITNHGEVEGFSSGSIDRFMLYSRFQRVGDKVYWGATCGYGLALGCFYNNQSFRKLFSAYCTWVESWDGGVPISRYQQDFCIIQNGNQRIACFLGLKAATTSWNASDLNSACGWNSTYVNWALKNLVCILYSFPISNDTTRQEISGYNTNVGGGTNLNTPPQNVIYNTNIVRGENKAVDIRNTSAGDDRRLYLNTQMLVAYTAASGRTYFIFAYCYPGQSRQLYLCYAPYVVDRNNRVLLTTLTELRDRSGNSFGSFTSCSRIITMDLKAGHLWITFMNSDSTAYCYFHIKAKDLIEE